MNGRRSLVAILIRGIRLADWPLFSRRSVRLSSSYVDAVLGLSGLVGKPGFDRLI